MGHATAHFTSPTGEGSKGQISLNFNYKVNFKYFIPKRVCFLTTRFSFCPLGHAPWVGLGVLGSQKFDFSEHGHVVYQIEGDDE